ncbi:Alpha/Beta hydrolase protein [Pisolithus croceorrhizus]|nr:Alpha/Beta hydrolase protein [Pisolithus croceorrhizus]
MENPGSLYKKLKTARGYTYNYLSVRGQAGRPTLLFMHGFPDTSHGWHHQISYFRTKGYGLVVPDMLGYGGTDKPTDPAAFSHLAIAQDIMDVLNAEGAYGVYAIAHDWGSSITSILSIKHSERFLGFVFIAVPYSVPSKFPPVELALKEQERVFGRPAIGYWTFLTKDNAAPEIEKHIESLLDVFYPADPEIWLTLMNIPGNLESFVVEGRRLASANYLPEIYREQLKNLLLQGGMTSPLTWYNCMVQGVNDDIINGLQPEDLLIRRPTLMAFAKFDYVAIENYVRPIMHQHTPPELLTEREYDTGHWIHLEDPLRFNSDLEQWIETVTKSRKIP